VIDLTYMMWQRGPLMEKIDRESGDSQPLPDDLVARIEAAGLTAQDEGRCLRLYRDGQLMAYVTGRDAYIWAYEPIAPDGEPTVGPNCGEMNTLWWANCHADNPRSEGVRWGNYLDAVRWVLDGLLLRFLITAPYATKELDHG
jgi:hypothetical protein